MLIPAISQKWKGVIFLLAVFTGGSIFATSGEIALGLLMLGIYFFTIAFVYNVWVILINLNLQAHDLLKD